MNSDRVVSLVLYSDGIFQLSVSGGEKKEGSVNSKSGVFKFQIEEGSFNGKQPSNVKLLHKTEKELKHLFL